MTFSDSYIRSKNKLLVLAGICLFIGISEALPQQVSLIGLDLSAKPEVFGWFILAVTCYFFIISVVFGALDLIKYYLPSYIITKGVSVTGSVIGLTEEDCQSENFEHYLDQPEVGTAHSELKDIQSQRKEIGVKYNAQYLKISNVAKIFFDIVFPLVFSITSVSVAINFLWPSCG